MSAYPLNTTTLQPLLKEHASAISASLDQLASAVMAVGVVIIRASRASMSEDDAKAEIERLFNVFSGLPPSRP